MQCGLNIQAHCVPALRRAERNLCRNYNVHNCLLGEYNRFHCGHKRFKTQLRRTWVVSIAGWVRKEVVSLCVRAASVITQLGAFSLQFRSRSSSVFVARWRSGLTIALCSPFHSHSGISQHVSQKKRYNFIWQRRDATPVRLLCVFHVYVYRRTRTGGALSAVSSLCGYKFWDSFAFFTQRVYNEKYCSIYICWCAFILYQQQ